MANPLVPTAYDVVMTVLSLLVLAGLVVGVVILLRRSDSRRAQVVPTERVDQGGPGQSA